MCITTPHLKSVFHASPCSFKPPLPFHFPIAFDCSIPSQTITRMRMKNHPLTPM